MSIASRRGYDFEQQWEEALKNEGYDWIYKVNDARSMKGFNLPYAPKVPFDFMAAKYKIIEFFECKQTRQTALPIDAIKPHQLDNLLRLEELGFDCWFVINFNNRIKTKEGRINKVWKIKASVMNDMINTTVFNLNRKSIARDRFMNMGWVTGYFEAYEWTKVNEYVWVKQ